MTIFARPSEWNWSGSKASGHQPPTSRAHLYFAFLSYSHADSAEAKWLHEAIESFRVPRYLVGRLTEHGAIPRRLSPVFRDLGELPASDNLGSEIRTAIAGSRCLIVLCSPATAKSRWAGAEIKAFRRAHPEGCLLAAILEGEPFATDIPGREHEECLPHALRVAYDRNGRQTGKRAEPMCADLRGGPADRRTGFLKLIAGMLGIGFDELVQRDTLRRHRRMALTTAGSLVGMLVTSGLAVVAIQAGNSAREQRRQAESLVEFMVGDLRTRLEPIGRLDVLDSVAQRALGYYENSDIGALSDESLVQRSKAMTLMGEIAQSRGDLATALRFYRQAFAQTAESLRRDTDNPQRMFDHAQNVFWVGYIDWQRGNSDRAEAAFREYDRLARAMVAAEPTNTKWLLERTYANTVLGTVQMDRSRYSQASDSFREAMAVSEGLVAIDSRNPAFQDQLAESMAWLADAREMSGSIDEALGLRQRHLALLRRLQEARPRDAPLKRKIMGAYRGLGRLYASRGETARALDSLGEAAAVADAVLRTDPRNAEWTQSASNLMFDRSELQLASGRIDAAAESLNAGCTMSQDLAARDKTVVEWAAVLPGRCLDQKADLALARDSVAEAQGLAQQSFEIARREAQRKPTPASRLALARAELLRGDIANRLGNRASARAAWQAANDAWPRDIELTPQEMAIRAQLLRNLGAIEESRRLTQRLAAIGYRHPAYFKA